MELKRTCEGVIDNLAEPLCTPLRELVAQVDAHHNAALGSTNTKTGPVTAHSWAQQEVAEKLDADFRSLCARELRAGAARVGLYLEDRRTADVLLSHVRERAAEVYCDFADLVGSMYAGTLKGRVLDAARVNEVLRGNRREGGVSKVESRHLQCFLNRSQHEFMWPITITCKQVLRWRPDFGQT